MLDRVGMTGSLLCALHCAALPIALLVLPSVGLALAFNDPIEWTFVGIATVVGALSLVRGFRLHRVALPLLLLVPGLVLLWGGIGWAPLHHARIPHALAMALGGTLVAVAHYANLHHSRRATAPRAD